MGLLWYTKKKYKDFILKIDWKVNRRNDNSGVFIRFSDPDNDPWIAVNTGYEIQIDDLAMPDGNPIHKTGAIYNFAAPSNNKSDNSGIFVRFPYPDNDPMVAVNKGYEIQIDDLAMPDRNPIHKTGAIYNFAAPSNNKKVQLQSPSKPVDEWNTFEIETINQKYSVILNGKK